MGPLGVVASQPVRRDRPNFGERREDVRIQDLRAVGLVAALDEGVLRRLPRLDEGEVDALLLGPGREADRQKLRPVIRSAAGAPCSATSSSSRAITRRLGREKPISNARPSRWPWSRTFSVRNTRPS